LSDCDSVIVVAIESKVKKTMLHHCVFSLVVLTGNVFHEIVVSSFFQFVHRLGLSMSE